MEKAYYFIFVTLMVGVEVATYGYGGIPNRNPIAGLMTTSVSPPILKPEKNCGKIKVVCDRILNGDSTPLGDLPWMAAIGFQNVTNKNSSIKWLCSGTLITRRYVITAAICTDFIDNFKPVIVRLGDSNLDPSINEGARPLNIRIGSTIKHERYLLNNQYINDIGIIKLKHCVIFTEFIQPICLPTSQDVDNMDMEGKTLVIAGWGATKTAGPINKQLMSADIPITNHTECKQIYANVSKALIDDTVICAGHPDGAKDSCQGDSGGPLMFSKENTYYLMGITSYGPTECGQPGKPTVYTRVPYFIDWILWNLRDYTNQNCKINRMNK